MVYAPMSLGPNLRRIPPIRLFSTARPSPSWPFSLLPRSPGWPGASWLSEFDMLLGCLHRKLILPLRKAGPGDICKNHHHGDCLP